MTQCPKIGAQALGDSSHNEDVWEERDLETNDVMQCFRSTKLQGQMGAADVVVRVNGPRHRLEISSEGWIEPIRIQSRNVLSVTPATGKGDEVDITHRTGLSTVEIIQLRFASAISLSQFVKNVMANGFGTAAAAAAQDSSPAALATASALPTIDTSAVDLSPDLVELCHTVNDRLKLTWVRDNAKIWLKTAADAVLAGQDSALFLGVRSSVTYEFTDQMVRSIIASGYTLEPSDTVAVVDESLVTTLAANMHSHWCRLVERLQGLAAKGFSKTRIAPRRPEYFRPVPFAQLPQAEQSPNIADARNLLLFVTEAGYAVGSTDATKAGATGAPPTKPAGLVARLRNKYQ